MIRTLTLLFLILLLTAPASAAWHDDIVLVYFNEGSASATLPLIESTYNVVNSKELDPVLYELELPAGSDEEAVRSNIESQYPNDVRFTLLSEYTTSDPIDKSSTYIDPVPATWDFPFTNTSIPVDQWGLADDAINVSDAWDITTGDPSTVVIVVDSGIQVNHPDFDPTGRTSVEGMTFTSQPWDADGYGHGTAVASIIWGSHGNGLYGVAPDVKLWSWQVTEPGTGGGFNYEVDALLDALLYLRSIAQADCSTNYIVNISVNFGTSINSDSARAINATIEDAVTACGNVLFVAAVAQDNSWNGNELIVGKVVVPAAFSGAGDVYPSLYSQYVDDCTLAVSSITASTPQPYGPNGDHGFDYEYTTAFGQNWGYLLQNEPGICFGACVDTCTLITDCAGPGGGHSYLNPNQHIIHNGIGVLVANNSTSGYYWDSGSSLAAPHVAGVAALAWSVDSGYSAEDIKYIVRRSADLYYIDTTDDNFDKTVTYRGVGLHEHHNLVIGYESQCPGADQYTDPWTPGTDTLGKGLSGLDDVSSVVIGSGMADASLAVAHALNNK